MSERRPYTIYILHHIKDSNIIRIRRVKLTPIQYESAKKFRSSDIDDIEQRHKSMDRFIDCVKLFVNRNKYLLYKKIKTKEGFRFVNERLGSD